MAGLLMAASSVLAGSNVTVISICSIICHLLKKQETKKRLSGEDCLPCAAWQTFTSSQIRRSKRRAVSTGLYFQGCSLPSRRWHDCPSCGPPCKHRDRQPLSSSRDNHLTRPLGGPWCSVHIWRTRRSLPARVTTGKRWIWCGQVLLSFRVLR